MAFWSNKKKECELNEELQSHLKMAIRDHSDRGAAQEEAQRDAQREFGNVPLIQEIIRDSWSDRWLSDLLADVRFGLRMLSADRGFAAIVILTMALGIGASTSVFSLLNAVLLRSLPYGDPSRLVYLYTPNPRFPQVPVNEFVPTNADYFDIKRQSQSYALMTLFGDRSRNLATSSSTQRIRGASVDADFFATLQVLPELGRAIDSTDDQPGHEHVVVISHALWSSLFGGRPDVLSKSIQLDGQNYLVIGVMPPEFQYPHEGEVGQSQSNTPANVWTPMALTPQQKTDRDSDSANVIARLRPGVKLTTAQAELSSIMTRLDLLHDPNFRGFQAVVRPFMDSVVGGVRALMALLFGAVMLVLVIACGNAANLLLARATSRNRELGVRAALGAGRFRLIRQMMTEALLLSGAAGFLGIALAHFSIRVLLKLNPGNIPRLDEISIDKPVLLFTASVAILSGIFFGLLPALSASRTDVNDLLRLGGTRTTDSRGNRARSVLVVGQIAMSVMLLAGAGLLIRSYLKLQRVDKGFSESTVSLQVTLDSRFQRPEQNLGFYRELLNKFATFPGVASVGAVTNLPFSHSDSMTIFALEGYANQKDQLVDSRQITPDYFGAMGTRLVAGRFFNDSDAADRPGVVIVNEAFVKNFFPGQNPLSRHFAFNDFAQGAPKNWSTIVGIVGDMRHSTVDETPRPQVYTPLWQSSADSLYFAIRSSLPPESIKHAIPEIVRSVDRQIAAADIHTMSELVATTEGRRRFQTFILGVFAGVALFLATTGLYGVMTYSVRQRRQEFGIRIALGAQKTDILKSVLGRGILLTFLGLTLGLLAAAVLTRLVASMLYGVSSSDPLTLSGVASLLLVAGITACYLPARRATKVDPMIAIRYE